MGHKRTTTDDVEPMGNPEYGAIWLLRDALETEHLGVSVMELEPGGHGKPHDHTDDGQEEVYVAVEGSVEIKLNDEEVVDLGRNEALRVDPEEHRQLFNRGESRARLVIVGSP